MHNLQGVTVCFIYADYNYLSLLIKPNQAYKYILLWQLALREPKIERHKLDQNFSKALKLTDRLCCSDPIHVSQFLALQISSCGWFRILNSKALIFTYGMYTRTHSCILTFFTLTHLTLFVTAQILSDHNVYPFVNLSNWFLVF